MRNKKLNQKYWNEIIVYALKYPHDTLPRAYWGEHTKYISFVLASKDKPDTLILSLMGVN